MNDVGYQSVNLVLVEDDDVDAMSLARALKKLRMPNPLFRARDGVEALELLRSGEIAKPLIILLDLNMPRMGGLELLKNLRSDEDLRGCVVFVLTTSENEKEIALAYKLNVAGYIVKRMGGDFSDLFQLLDQYWRLVELPE